MGIFFTPASLPPTHLYHLFVIPPIILLFPSPLFHIHLLCAVFSTNNLERRCNDDDENCLSRYRFLSPLISQTKRVPLRNTPKRAWADSRRCRASKVIRLRSSWDSEVMRPQRAFTDDSCFRSTRTVYKVPSTLPNGRKPPDRQCQSYPRSRKNISTIQHVPMQLPRRDI